LANLQAIREYIRQFNPHAATKVAAEIIETGDGLANFPYRGRSVGKGPLREVVTAYPYTIRYRINDGDVIILRVRHTARRPT
jgi:plasmid stabilization system protein ParE